MVDQRAGAGDRVWGWETFLQEMETFLTTVDREIDYTQSTSYAQFVIERFEVCIHALSSLRVQIEDDGDDETIEVCTALKEIMDSCVLLKTMWYTRLDELDAHTDGGYQVPQVARRVGRGRPQLFICQDQLEYLCSLNFTWTEISKLLGVSRMTIYRRRREFGILDVHSAARSISDSDLRTKLQQVRREMPNMGETLVIGRLRSLGYAVTRQRVRNAIHATDPLNAALRWRGILTARRPYSVPSPNSLWHMDGHHKLVRWGMVTHGAIDGYSRLVVFLRCSNNNTAETVYNLFLSAVQRFGLPSRMRSDYGGENYRVAAHMLESRGYDRNSMITGSSVHNQRIERLWRDMHRCVTVIFYKLFYYLEQHGYLDPDNMFHRYCLQYVYLPRINQSLKVFMEGWNCHGVRTEHNLTPHQLFVRGALQMQRRGLQALDFFEHIDEMYGVDEEISTGDDDYTVRIPPIGLALSDENMALLKERVNPLADSDNFGIELYVETLTFLRTLIN
ncbi:uncharacterized protein LOC135333721 [Halichondria panicea]|uniref:uncharacterized protein LOC135333721 n=2 Tax=Halichondria panicea TaxID=6063 RepID=UPI00312B3042